MGPIGSAVRASASKHLSLPSPPRLRCSAAARKLARLRERRCAFVMLQATHDVRNVTLWLGHADIRTTEVYLRMDLSEKRSRCRSAGTETGPLQGTRRTDRVFARGYAGVASKESASCLRMRCSMLNAQSRLMALPHLHSTAMHHGPHPGSVMLMSSMALVAVPARAEDAAARSALPVQSLKVSAAIRSPTTMPVKPPRGLSSGQV